MLLVKYYLINHDHHQRSVHVKLSTGKPPNAFSKRVSRYYGIVVSFRTIHFIITFKRVCGRLLSKLLAD